MDKRVGQKENFDDVPLPEEVQRDISPILPKKKFNFVALLIVLSILVLCGGAIYILFFDETPIIKNSYSNVDLCSKLDISVSSLSTKTCYDANQSLLKVFVERGSNAYVLKSMNFFVYSSSSSLAYSSDYYLPKNGEYTYIIDTTSLSNIRKFDVVPILSDGSTKNCSKITVTAIYPCLVPIEVSSGESILNFSSSGSISTNNITNNSNVSTNQTNTSITLGGSSSYSSGSSSGSTSSGSQINLSTYTNNTSSVSSSTIPSGSSSNSGSASGAITPSQVCTSYPSISISTCQQLQDMKNNLCGKYSLTGNIDCSATSGWNEGLGFEPVGSDMQDIFAGSLDGKGYQISNLFINRSDENSVGLFGVSKGNISNIKLTNVNIEGSWSVGALIGEQYSGRIYKVSSTGRVVGGNLVGGLIGELNSYSSSTSFVSQSYSSAIVSGEANVGGFVGVIMDDSVVENCYATGSVSADNTIGGFVGSSNGIVRNSYSSGLVSGDMEIDLDIGGFTGFSSGIGEITSSYFDMQTSNQSLSEEDMDSPYAEAKTTSQMKSQATYSGWDFTNVWKMSGYPVFK